MSLKKTKAVTLKVGTYIKANEKEYRHCEYEGVITEVHKDLIQIYGTGYCRDLGFIELRIKEMSFATSDKAKVKFLVDQEIRKLDASKLKTEHKLNDLIYDLNEARENRDRFLT